MQLITNDCPMKATWFGTRPAPIKLAGTAVGGEEGREVRVRKVTKSDTANILYCTIMNSVVEAIPVSVVYTQGDV